MEVGEVDHVVLLAGGVGASKLAVGLSHLLEPGRMTIISNVADDEEVYGLHVSPDIDIVTYALVGMVDEAKGWGVAGDTFNCDGFLRLLGEEPWLLLGDKDLAVNIARTNLLKQGARLSEVTRIISEAMGARHRIIPVTDNRLTTFLYTDAGPMSFERYYVQEAQNHPILSVKKVRASIIRSHAFKVAVSPIIAGRTVKGPADKMLRALGYDASPVGVAEFYDGLLDCLLLDTADAGLERDVSRMGIRAVVDNIMMTDLPAKVRLGRSVLEAKPST
ncbi:MAG: 2-phospho-L-lactate transferase CofD family protein [Conexivisphaerales archaeon]